MAAGTDAMNPLTLCLPLALSIAFAGLARVAGAVIAIFAEAHEMACAARRRGRSTEW